MNLILFNLCFFNFFFLIKTYDLDLYPISRNVLCFLNINKNCSSEYFINKDKELFFLNNNENSTTNENSILEEHKKDRWVYIDTYIFETEKYFVVPFSIPYENINKAFVFFPDKNFNEDEAISFSTLNSSKVCYNIFYKSQTKFYCIFLKEDMLDLLNKKISLYTVLNIKSSLSSMVFDVILKLQNKTNDEFSHFIDTYKLPNNFNYFEYMKIKEYKVIKQENKKIKESENTDNLTSCEKTIDLEKCYKEKYLINPCDKNKFYYCFLKNNKITKINLQCYKNLIFNNVFKFCENFFKN